MIPFTVFLYCMGVLSAGLGLLKSFERDQEVRYWWEPPFYTVAVLLWFITVPAFCVIMVHSMGHKDDD